MPLSELPARLQAVADNSAFVPVDIFSTLPTSGPLSLPAPAADALLEAVYTALENASRHSGAPRASVTVGLVDGRLRVEVADGGRGFDPLAVPQRRLGIRLSIAQRAQDAGGSATVESSPGAGTKVTLDWMVDSQ